MKLLSWSGVHALAAGLWQLQSSCTGQGTAPWPGSTAAWTAAARATCLASVTWICAMAALEASLRCGAPLDPTGAPSSALDRIKRVGTWAERWLELCYAAITMRPVTSLTVVDELTSMSVVAEPAAGTHRGSEGGRQLCILQVRRHPGQAGEATDLADTEYIGRRANGCQCAA